MENQYMYANRMAELYQLLDDQRSKDVFWARLRGDMEPTTKNKTELFELSECAIENGLHIQERLKAISDQAAANGKKLFLYGTNMSGEVLGELILQQGGDFYAYCSRKPERFASGFIGKPVYSPDYVFEHPEDCYVLIAASGAAAELYQILLDHKFPEDHIFFGVQLNTLETLLKKQYFDFPQFFAHGKAFVDGGCYDCGTSKRFAEWCKGEYSKIIAFEPDPKNAQRCRAIADSSNLRLELIPSGLSDRTGTATFAANGNTSSYIVNLATAEKDSKINIRRNQVTDEVVTTIQVTALDDVTQETEIGFIKMDIEGAELSALHGAKQTIQRDKPLLAICVYHKCGDVLAIMDYLHELVPQYRFWLRHYDFNGCETVLYAYAD